MQRLGLGAVELLLTHAPDDDTPIEETLEGLEAIRVSGRCRTLGACNVTAEQLTAALDAAERLDVDGYRVVQNGYSLLQPDADQDVRALCADRGVAYTAYSPLSGGALTGKYRRGTPPPAGSRLALRPEGTDELLTHAVRPSWRRSPRPTRSELRRSRAGLAGRPLPGRSIRHRPLAHRPSSRPRTRVGPPPSHTREPRPAPDLVHRRRPTTPVDPHS